MHDAGYRCIYRSVGRQLKDHVSLKTGEAFWFFAADPREPAKAPNHPAAAPCHRRLRPSRSERDRPGNRWVRYR